MNQRRTKTPTMLQMEIAECGAAALGMVLGYHGKYIPLEQLRIACGVSRDGSNALNLIKAAQGYGLEAHGLRRSTLDGLKAIPLPAILHWNFNHFVVLEGFGKSIIFINDPAAGPREVTFEEFDRAYTGLVLTFQPSDTFQKQGQPFSVIGALWKRLRGAETAVAFLTLISLFLVLPGLIIPAFLRVFVDEILVNGQDWLVPLLIGMTLAITLRAGMAWLQQNALLRMENWLAIRMSVEFIWHVLMLPTLFFAQRQTGEIVYRIGLNDTVAKLLSSEVANTIINVVLIVFYALLMLQYNVPLTLLGAGAAVLNLVILARASRHRMNVSRALLAERGRMFGTVSSSLQVVENTKAIGAENEVFSRWTGIHARLTNLEQRLAYTTHILTAFSVFLFSVNAALVLVLGSELVLQGQMTIGMLVAFQSLLFSFTQPVGQLVNFGSQLQEVESDLSRLDDVLNHHIDESLFPVDDSTEPRSVLQGELMIRDLSFGFNPTQPPFVQDFSLHALPRQRIAIVGASGSGKSTVARLIAGLYSSWSGEILLDDEPRSAIPRKVVSRSFAFIDQSTTLFAGTVWDNLTLWDSAAPKTLVVNAAQDACIHETITQRDGGYNYWLEEGGANLSGGERQRIEIARALVNLPTILILDEATSALDVETEAKIFHNLQYRGCTCVIISHRLNTIQDCDEIIVLKAGQIVARGKHDNLLQMSQEYLQLWNATPEILN